MPQDSNETLALILRRLDQLDAKLETLTPVGAPQYLTVAEAGEAYRVSPDTIRRACDRRELRYSQDKPGAAIRIATKDLQAWADKRATAPLRKKTFPA